MFEVKGGEKRFKNLMLKEHFPISYNMVSEDSLAFPFSKANQSRKKKQNTFFLYYVSNEFLSKL